MCRAEKKQNKHETRTVSIQLDECRRVILIAQELLRFRTDRLRGPTVRLWFQLLHHLLSTPSESDLLVEFIARAGQSSSYIGRSYASSPSPHKSSNDNACNSRQRRRRFLLKKSLLTFLRKSASLFRHAEVEFVPVVCVYFITFCGRPTSTQDEVILLLIDSDFMSTKLSIFPWPGSMYCRVALCCVILISAELCWVCVRNCLC